VRWNLPNVITTARIVLAPVLVFLLYVPSMTGRLLAFAVFVVAAVSDLWDGWLARRRGEITDFGKLADPLADKLLLAAALLPLYLLGRSRPELAGLPLYGHVSLWIVLVLLGRELIVTVLRTLAARLGTVVPARRAGKYKTVAQNLFIGGTILWMALRTAAAERAWEGAFWEAWQGFHGWFVTVTLSAALLLTVVSLGMYLGSFRGVLGSGRGAPGSEG
jgi:CDP-diacylglycerol--glycerol-3-phosphate 3-phosphatidyltransferase